MNRTLDVATSLFATLARLGGGLRVEKLGERPLKPLELYEFEGFPNCRKEREVLNALDLEP
ncbi:MAG: glutathione S-transferase, partial [Proteobacteria bacterium]|nr:glutathione S-transferase [Pseudomonadota bacterium]